MRKIDTIRIRLEEALAPLRLQILDESAHHQGHAGAYPEGESHFRVEITSRAFAGLSRIERHRKVHAALDDVFQQGLHALVIVARTPEE